MEVATFWEIGEKRVCTGGHESDGYSCLWFEGIPDDWASIALEEFTCAMYGRRQLKDVNVLAIHAHQGEVWVTRLVY